MQPSPILPTLWKDISMDFIESLENVGNKSFIILVVDRLSKYAYFILHLFTLAVVVQILLKQNFKIHGMATSIISNHDPTFINKFWKELFKLHGTQLKMSTSYHPQIDG